MNGNTHSPEQQREVVRQIISGSPPKNGEYCYIISGRWWRQWKLFVSYGGGYYSTTRHEHKPDTINNGELFVDSNNPTKLRDMLIDGFDYEFVTEDAWKYLHQCYGGGPEIKRKLVTLSYSSIVSPELYPPVVKIHHAHTSAGLEFSRSDTIATLVEKSCKHFQIDEEAASKLCVFEFSYNQKGKQYKDRTQTLYDERIQEGMTLLLEDESESNSPAQENISNGYSTYSPTYFPYGGGSSSVYPRAASPINFSTNFANKQLARGPYEVGLCGLSNLGNTCFMNSALQCMMHTPVLVEFFVTDGFRRDLNRKNPLGMQGQVAEAFATLLKEVWSGYERAVSPRDFKYVLGKFAPQFVGFQQHDSQELLAYLLDGLHEDLNRVKDKPHTTNIASDGRPDEIVSVLAWDTHLRRNQSIIVDLFQGQLKSTLVCPVCTKVSITFDPFMFLSLPLQIPKTEFTIAVTMIYYDSSRPAEKFGVIVSRNGKVRDIKRKLAELCNIPDETMIAIADVYEHSVHCVFADTESVEKASNAEDKIYAFELMKPSNCNEEVMCIPVINRALTPSPPGHIPKVTAKEMGFPFFICVPRASSTYKTLYLQIWKQMSYFFTPKWMQQNEAQLLKILPTLFTLKVINNTKAIVKELENSELPVVIKDKHKIAVDWAPNAFYSLNGRPINERTLIVHDSVYIQPPPTAPKATTLSLYKCLETFITEERLGPNDPWYCPDCKEHREASKKIDLWQLPKVLVIHLKRFSFSRFLRDKIDTFVDFPLEGLNMTYITIGPKDKELIYDLFAVSNHYGGLGGGHYTAYAKIVNGKGNGSWYSFDDSHCAPTTEVSVKSPAAYVLFYKQREG